MSRKHYQEVQFASEVTLTTSYRICLPHAGRLGWPTKYGNHTGVPKTCLRGYLGSDGDQANQQPRIEFSINGVVHEEVDTFFPIGGGVEQVVSWILVNPLTLQNGDELTCRMRFLDAGSGIETYVVLIFEWEGDLP